MTNKNIQLINKTFAALAIITSANLVIYTGLALISKDMDIRHWKHIVDNTTGDFILFIWSLICSEVLIVFNTMAYLSLIKKLKKLKNNA